jgi:hypothetical protein
MPLCDARLVDGSRVNAMLPPITIDGPTLTIRKFAKERLTVDDLIRFGTGNTLVFDLQAQDPWRGGGRRGRERDAADGPAAAHPGAPVRAGPAGPARDQGVFPNTRDQAQMW